ncbi:MAG: carboxypeptidase-like regulatory domain-containing protein [Acidobacteriota bacterium]
MTSLLYFFSVTGLAQFDPATVLGTVRDSNGSVLPGVTVTLKNIGTSIAVNTQTDADGNFQFTNVRIGDYRVSAEKSGFSTAVAERVNVTVSARQRVDLAMQPGAVTETVVITDAAQLLETDSSVRGQVVQREQIVNLPLNGRSYAYRVLLAPGVRESNQNAATGGGREAAFNVNGLRNTFNNFHAGRHGQQRLRNQQSELFSQVVQSSPDAIAEFKLQTNTYSAEFGRSGGAVFNASYRSGTNEFPGSLWEFHRNSGAQRDGIFKPVGGTKPPLIRNQFGFGGRADHQRPHLLFPGLRRLRRNQKNLVFSTIPTLEQRQGILTAASAIR